MPSPKQELAPLWRKSATRRKKSSRFLIFSMRLRSGSIGLKASFSSRLVSIADRKKSRTFCSLELEAALLVQVESRISWIKYQLRSCSSVKEAQRDLSGGTGLFLIQVPSA